MPYIFKRKCPAREWKGLPPKLFHRKRSQTLLRPWLWPWTWPTWHRRIFWIWNGDETWEIETKPMVAGLSLELGIRIRFFFFFLIGFESPNLCILWLLSWVGFGYAILFSFLFFFSISLGSVSLDLGYISIMGSVPLFSYDSLFLFLNLGFRRYKILVWCNKILAYFLACHIVIHQ